MVATKFPDKSYNKWQRVFSNIKLIEMKWPRRGLLRISHNRSMTAECYIHVIFFYHTLKLCMKGWCWDIIALELLGLRFFNVNIFYQCFLFSVRLFFHLGVALCQTRKNVLENQHLSIDTSIWFLLISWYGGCPIRTNVFVAISAIFQSIPKLSL